MEVSQALITWIVILVVVFALAFVKVTPSNEDVGVGIS